MYLKKKVFYTHKVRLSSWTHFRKPENQLFFLSIWDLGLCWTSCASRLLQVLTRNVLWTTSNFPLAWIFIFVWRVPLKCRLSAGVGYRLQVVISGRWQVNMNLENLGSNESSAATMTMQLTALGRLPSLEAWTLQATRATLEIVNNSILTITLYHTAFIIFIISIICIMDLELEFVCQSIAKVKNKPQCSSDKYVCIARLCLMNESLGFFCSSLCPVLRMIWQVNYVYLAWRTALKRYEKKITVWNRLNNNRTEKITVKCYLIYILCNAAATP